MNVTHVPETGKKAQIFQAMSDGNLSKTPKNTQFPTRGGARLEPILREACSQVYPESAICVQRFDDSLNSAIRITYRISLRSSSLREPRYPLLRVVRNFVFHFTE
jgi:hypothetical protein